MSLRSKIIIGFLLTGFVPLFTLLWLQQTIGQLTEQETMTFIIGCICLLILAAIAMNIWMTHPIHKVIQHIKKCANGNLHARNTVRTQDDIGTLAEAMNTLSAAMQEEQFSLAKRIRERTKDLQIALEKEQQSRTALLNVMEDMQDTQADLEQSVQDAQMFRKAVESSSEAMCITSSMGDILYVNSAFTTITGYSADDVLGNQTSILKSDKTDPKIYEDLWKHVSEGKTFSTDELINKRKDGTEYWADISIFPIVTGDTPDMYVAVHKDATQRKKAERAKSEFIAIASHQLRTPLTGIRWCLSHLLHKAKDIFTDKQLEMVASGYSASKRMAETISSMLTLSNIEAGRAKPTFEKMTLRSVVDTALEECSHIQENKHIQFTINCPEDITIVSDKNFLTAILLNLLSNAIRYTPEQGSITLTASHRDEEVHITVQDTGCGIPKDQQHQIFSRFFRADNATNLVPDGSGIGLYIVKGLTELLGGEIHFISEEGVGTTFSLELPNRTLAD